MTRRGSMLIGRSVRSGGTDDPDDQFQTQPRLFDTPTVHRDTGCRTQAGHSVPLALNHS